jgi:hypothetical protein
MPRTSKKKKGQQQDLAVEPAASQLEEAGPPAPALSSPPMTRPPFSIKHALDLPTAISEIFQTYEEAAGQPYGSPFFFIIGAGVSYPSVPLASDIIEHLRGIAEKYRRTGNPSASSTLDTYSHWFSLAYPNPRQRQKFLRELVERQPISLANLRLAHLLGARKLTNLVVTTNFDDYLSKALRLFGNTPAVCDHTRTVARIDAERGDLQIVHVHGSYLFYDTANLREEVANRALADENSSLTIRGLLDSVLWTRSPLVVGYSGWDGDVIMEALKGRLLGGHPLAQAIYWFCYSRECAETAPEWLRLSEHVRFVVPPEPSPESYRPGSGLQGDTPGEQRIKEPRLEAREVFDSMIQAFKLPPPALLENPLDFFASQLEASLPQASGKDDLYSFRTLIQRLRKAASSSAPAMEGRFSEPLDRLRLAMQSSNYRDAILACEALIPHALMQVPEEDRQFILKSASIAGDAMIKDHVPADLRHALSRVFIHDPAREELTGSLPSSMIVLYPSRVNQMAYETQTPKGPHGAFTANFVAAFSNPKADTNKDGLISLTEAALFAGEHILGNKLPQTPVVVNSKADFALFATPTDSKTMKRSGVLRALLVGLSRYKEKSMQLPGVKNDIRLVADLLESSNRRCTRAAEVSTLLNQQATAAKTLSNLRRMVAASQENDVLFFYFSGHGAHGSADSLSISSLVMWEFDQDIKHGLLPIREAIDALSGGRAAHRVIIID